MRILTATLLLVALFTCARSQKLPNVQQASLRAPADIKIDGKADEVGGKFQAYNSATELFYTLANDDKKLYLVVQTSSYTVMNRIASGGIKFVIQKNGAKNDARAPFIKFPFLEKPKQFSISFVNLRMAGKNGMERVPDPESPIEAQKIYDSLARNNNKKLTRELKWIYVSGISDVDSLIAIYNDKGIQAANATDSKKTYTCEMSIDLKLLGMQASDANKFSYHVVVNGEPNKFVPAWAIGVVAGNADTEKAVNKLLAETSATTDFWGEYTLVK